MNLSKANKGISFAFNVLALVAMVKQVFGIGETMSQTETPLYIVAWDARKRDIKVFGPGDTLVPIWYAVRCSMAASTYFAPMGGYTTEGGVFRILKEGRYTDGGFTANDPLVHGMAAGFMDNLIRPDGLRCLELVTSGKTKETGPIDPDWNILTTLKRVVLPAVTAGNSSDAEFIARAWLKSLQQSMNNLFRVSLETPDFAMDSVEESAFVEKLWGVKWENDYGALVRFLAGVKC